MRRSVAVLLAVAASLQTACAGMPGARAPRPGGASEPPAAVAPGVAPPFAALAARFTDRALEQVRAGELRRARDSWRVVAALRPEAAEPRRQVEELTARLAEAAARHYRDGLSLLQEGKTAAARRELLLALLADPDHALALEVLKSRLEPDAVPVTVVAGDSFESIAKRHYGDAGMSSLVARINGLDPSRTPEPGTVLSLPVLAPPIIDAETRAAETADPSYSTDPAAIGRDAPPPASPTPIPAAAPSPPSGAVAPAAPADAPPPQQRAADESSAEARERAEELYNTGVRFFINENLDAAIRSWERALLLNPAHPNASKDIEKARELQQKLKEIR